VLVGTNANSLTLFKRSSLVYEGEEVFVHRKIGLILKPKAIAAPIQLERQPMIK